LVSLGIILFFSARQDRASGLGQEHEEDLAGGLDPDGLDLMEEMWSSEEDDGVLVEHQQQRGQERHRREQEEFEDARVDDILARLHDSSLAELSPEEVDVLQRASQRYRRRRRSTDDA
jgi:hypothetical protein